MRRRRSGGSFGYIAIGAGLLVVISIVAPIGFWWLVIGVALIVAGIIALRSCC